MRNYILFVAALMLLGCSKPASTDQSTAGNSEAEAISFAGKPLIAHQADSTALAKSDSIIAAIKSKAEMSEDDYVDVGRQLVSTYRYKLAVANFTDGLVKYPNSFKLLRNRGHRYITLRQLDNAIADLTKAEELIRPQSEVWEYDATGKPSASVQHQIWYHIGIYHYLKKDYAKSALAFEQALAWTHEPANIVGATNWLYDDYKRLGQDDKAVALLTPITPDYNMDHEHAYFKRLMLYKGIITPEELINVNKASDSLSVQDITRMYGLANWYAYKGDKDKATGLYHKILESSEWAGFAYAASEIEVLNK
jgi:tetratricopeptide (TPR) repeat protein